MNIILSSTGFSEPNYSYAAISKDNLHVMDLETVDSLDNLIIHKCFHLLSIQKVIELISLYYSKLKENGKLIIYCIDIYQLCHKIHRRELSEGDFHNCMYDNGQQNCISTLFILENCIKAGFKKTGVSFNDIWAKMEFIK